MILFRGEIFDEFSNFLISKHIVNESKVQYYVRWVSKGLRGSNKSFGESLISTQTHQCLAHLSKAYEQVQVEQAALAIKIYHYYVKTISAPAYVSTVGEKEQWRFVADEMKTMLRLKQRALATERTYLSWLRRFYRVVEGKSPYKLDSNHVKNFLSYLALDQKVSKST